MTHHDTHRTGTREQWLAARLELLAVREGADPPQRRGRPPTPAAALGARREGLPLRDRRRRGVARRPVRRTLAAARLPLHVRTGLRVRVPVVLGDRRRLQRLRRPPRAPRRRSGRGLARSASLRSRPTSGAWAGPSGGPPRTTPTSTTTSTHRSPRRSSAPATPSTTTPHGTCVARSRRRSRARTPRWPAPTTPRSCARPRHQRLRARGRRRLPHLLGVCARPRRAVGHVPVAGPRAAGTQRGRGLVPSPRPVLISLASRGDAHICHGERKRTTGFEPATFRLGKDLEPSRAVAPSCGVSGKHWGYGCYTQLGRIEWVELGCP